VSAVPRHSEEELRQQWAFLDALVDRQAASLKSGVQDPEEDDLHVPMVAADSTFLEEISTLTQRVTTLEGERTTLLRRIDLAEEARMAAESARAAAEAARLTAERALADERSRLQPWPPVAAASAITPAPSATPVRPPARPAAAAPPGVRATPPQVDVVPPKATSPKSRRKSWWQRIRE
jgi:septal ring factor EnvC (AmiA/AmiB activator)